jgi:hypothetical protein
VLLLFEDFSEVVLPFGEVSLEAEFEDARSEVTGAGAATIGAG